MTHYSIKIDTYGTESPEIVETLKLGSSSYLVPADYMYHGEFENSDKALDAYAQEKGESDYCKSHDC